ncbi:hypothetical protein [Microbispora sp. KK1-11]|uniref:hypothetical protein n=1 Tax=Microbispora sp. KK1-11 TaxID=2053005 RepID=UPI00115B3398|nr:hypothetical protein [Microbispora sp. KK1-11]TQS30055.1 hypothetical protein FLW16_06755 [Microbispora sp. KK1-11]
MAGPRTTTKGKARPRPVAAVRDGDTPNVVRLSTSAAPVAVEKVPLFSIDDVEYGMPATIRPNVALKYLRMVRTQGGDVAEAWLLEEVLGAEAYEALMEYDQLTVDQLNQVMAIVRDHVLGQAEQQRAGNG